MLPSRGASSRLVANKHFKENMAPQSSLSMTELNYRFELLDVATTDCYLKS